MPAELALTTRTLTAVEFEHLAVVPPELEGRVSGVCG
jgi:hypothetical protein